MAATTHDASQIARLLALVKERRRCGTARVRTALLETLDVVG